ncbi:hypothetical protein [Mogibacterium diversum]|uniref:hypothetical protein n=1 Tax=Mogibacterium diversum TaxID=114527 RepID=UPI0026EFDCB9|nr:hypothetical protein [Mogibacterium diversum]
MTTITDWLGKVEDLTITYDAVVSQNNLLAESISEKTGLPSVIYPTSENLREVVEVDWTDNVKKADRTDYLLAITSGAIAGLIDSFFAGKFSLEHANKWGSNEINKFVKIVAHRNGYEGDKLSGAIAFMERKYAIAADSKTADFGGGLQHHLRDFSHHFSLCGLMCSIFTQFSSKVIGTDTNGKLLIVDVADKTLIGENFAEKVLFGIVHWFFHMVSDMAGSKSTAGKGTGIPGPILSLIKEASVLPCFRDRKIGENEIHVWISKLFNGTLLAKRDKNGKIIKPVKFDLRSEIGILQEFGRQSVPVIINECLVRGMYFLRRLNIAINEADVNSVKDLENIDISELLPFNNRIIRRMVTVSSGTFLAVDSIDATIRSAIKNKGINPKTFVDFAVHINYAGIGRFVIACKADGSIVAEDIREEKEKKVEIENEFEKGVANLECLSLNYEQLRVLYSLEKLILEDDIYITEKYSSKKLKLEWAKAWVDKLIENLSIAQSEKDEFFLSEEELGRRFQDNANRTWVFLVSMEASLFRPYYPIFGDDKDKSFKKLQNKSKYLNNRFIEIQNKVKKEDIEAFTKIHKKAGATITGTKRSIVISAVGTTVVVLVSGGLAFTFAPAIATAIIGEGAAGLSGAALTSYSLAAVGGGSLAAGGLGMAGGTAIITGGGAIVGMISGTGISAVTTMNLLSQDGYVLNECCKLLTFSQVVLRDKIKDYKTIETIYSKVDFRVKTLERVVEEFSKQSDEMDKEQKKEIKTKVKVAKKSIKYLKRCAEALQKLSNGVDVEVQYLLLPDSESTNR